MPSKHKILREHGLRWAALAGSAGLGMIVAAKYKHAYRDLISTAGRIGAATGFACILVGGIVVCRAGEGTIWARVSRALVNVGAALFVMSLLALYVNATE